MPGVEKFEDLLTWQLMFELSVEVWKVTGTPPSARDFRYRDQIRDSSDSAQRNVAEGFGRYNPSEFLRFLDIVKASADETRALLKKGHAVQYLSDERFAHLDKLSVRGLQALARLRRYLRTPEAKRNAERHRLRKQNRKSNTPNVSNLRNDSNDSNDSNDPNAPNDS